METGDKRYLELARVALTGRREDLPLLLRRVARSKGASEALASAITDLLRKSPSRSTPLRKSVDMPLPVDADSRFHLLRVEATPDIPHDPVFSEGISKRLRRLVQEAASRDVLFDVGLEPTRTVLFTGPPGVGKTMAARWLARESGRPLLILDLAAVISSYLGRTGSNLRHVLDYARKTNCVLLLDELDAIAKRRDDEIEVGELKRLVTVLLQELDGWGSESLLVAATNHHELLDPAVWRRFEEHIEFPFPERDAIQLFVTSQLAQYTPNAKQWGRVFAAGFEGRSFSDLERLVKGARRAAAMNGGPLDEHLGSSVANEVPRGARVSAAVELVRTELLSQRAAHGLTGVSRDTIRNHLQTQES